MSWWSKLWSTEPAQRPPPGWSAIDDGAAFDRFAALVTAKLEAEGLEPDRVAVRSGSIVIGEGRERKEWYLHALSDRCASVDETTWASVIAKSFSSIGQADAPEPKARRERKKREREQADPARPLKPLPDLRVQVFSERYLEALTIREVVSQPLSHDLRMVVVRDIGGMMEHMLTRREVRNWPRSEADLIALGRKNAVRAELGATVISSIESDAGLFELMVSNGFYQCACVVATLEAAAFPHGALVSFISWHHALVHKVTSDTSRATLLEMRRIADGIAEQIQVTVVESLGTTILWAHGDPPFAEVVVDGAEIVMPPALAAVLAAAEG